MVRGRFKVPEVQQESKEIDGFYSIKLEINDSTTSYNKDKAITLMSKDENCERLLTLARGFLNDNG
jgi:hypothetical protein